MPKADCARIIVTNIASTTTEEAIRDFFAFCGEIVHLEIYATSGGSSLEGPKKEAIIKFESGGAATTACLLNNALIDGQNVSVELFSGSEGGSPKPGFENPTAATQSASDLKGGAYKRAGTGSTSSFSSILGNISTSSLALASSVVSSVKSVNERYKVTEKVSSGASTAWRKSKQVASDIDSRFKVSENVAAAVQKTKENVSSAASSNSSKGNTADPKA